MRRILLATGVLALSTPIPALAGGGCHDENITEGSTAKVYAKDACFSPVVNRVAVGTTITWTNLDEMEHNVTGNGSLGFDELKIRQSVSRRFDKAGTYPYACTLHPRMAGVIVVGDGKGDGVGGVVIPEEPSPTLAPVADTVAIETDEARWTDNIAAVGGAGAGVLGLGVAAGFVFGRRRPE